MNFTRPHSPVHTPSATVKWIAGLTFPICGHQPPRKQMDLGKAGGCMPPRRHLLASAHDIPVLLEYLVHLHHAYLMSLVKLEMAHPEDHCSCKAAGHSGEPLPALLLRLIFLTSGKKLSSPSNILKRV